MHDTSRRVARLSICVAVVSVLATPLAWAQATTRPPLGKYLKASVSFAEHRYEPGDKAHITVTLRNNGSARLHHIGAACDRAGDPDEVVNTGHRWGALAIGASGVTLEPHQKRSFEVGTTVSTKAQRAGQVVVACDFGYRNDDQGYRPTAEDAARVPGQFGVLAGDVDYYVHGHSGASAGLENVRIDLVDAGRCPVYVRSATTDGSGHFRIAHAPAGSFYKLYLFPPKGWKVRGQNPTNGLIFGHDTTRFGLWVTHGTRAVPTPPTKCR